MESENGLTFAFACAKLTEMPMISRCKGEHLRRGISAVFGTIQKGEGEE